MRLTTQLRAEVDATRMRVEFLTCDVLLPLGIQCSRQSPALNEVLVSPEHKQIFDSVMQELSIYKVRLENILCETDMKEQDHFGSLCHINYVGIPFHKEIIRKDNLWSFTCICELVPRMNN